MAITTSPSKDRLFQSKRRSLGRDDLLLSSAVNRTTGASPLEATQRARRRRISQGGGWAKGRDRSQSRTRTSPTAVTKCLDNAVKIGPNYVWPVIAWELVLIPAILLLLAVLVVVAEPLVDTFHDAVCRVSPPAFPIWLSTLPGPLKGQDICVFPSQTAEQALFNDPTAIEALNDLPWPSTEIQKLQEHRRDTQHAIRVGYVGATIIRNQQYPHPRGLEVADLLDEWVRRHERSHELVKWLVYSQKALRESISWEARHAETTIDIVKRKMSYVEPNPIRLWDQSNLDELKSGWVPGYFTQTPLGQVVSDLESIARSHVKNAKTISKTVPRILQALGAEKKVLGNLKVTLPLNWKEFIHPANYDVGKDFKVLQDFLQSDFEQWLQGSLTLAVRFQRESDMLAEKLTDTALALRRVRWNRRDRVPVMRLWKHHVENLKANLADARAKFDAEFRGE